MFSLEYSNCVILVAHLLIVLFWSLIFPTSAIKRSLVFGRLF